MEGISVGGADGKSITVIFSRLSIVTLLTVIVFCANVSAAITAKVELKDNYGSPIDGAVVQDAYGGTWNVFGTTGGSGPGVVLKDFPDGTTNLKVRITYNQGSRELTQNIAVSPNFNFNTTEAIILFIDHAGIGLQGGRIDQGGSYWQFQGNTNVTGQLSLQVFGGSSYKFRVTYTSTAQEGWFYIPGSVVFQTGQVHWTGFNPKPVKASLGGSWVNFFQDMELLPGTYKFVFDDGTNKMITVVAGQISYVPSAPPSGMITITKIVNGTAPSATWEFTGGLGTFTLPSTGGSQTFTNLSGGNFSVSETVKTGYNISISCDNGFNGTNGVVLTLLPGQHVNCTFVNTKLYNLTVAGAGIGGGTVTNHGINCDISGSSASGDCSETAPQSTTFQLTATPDAISDFIGWSGDCDANGRAILDSDKTCTATFNLKMRTLTIKGTGNGNGTVTGPGVNCAITAGVVAGDCTETVAHGTPITLNAARGLNSVFVEWTGCDTATGTACNVVMNGDRTTTATFSRACPGVDVWSRPLRVSYYPTPWRASQNIIVVGVTNRGSVPVTITSIIPQAGEPFINRLIRPELPKIVPPGVRRIFYVWTARLAGLNQAVAERPYFDIELDCGVLSLA